MTDHPIQPTNKQILEWFEQSSTAKGLNQMDMPAAHVARMAYAAGADAELNACCVWIESLSGLGGLMTSAKFRCTVSDQLRAARRPKPPSLKEQASESLNKVVECLKMLVSGALVDGIHIETIRRALEQLDD